MKDWMSCCCCLSEEEGGRRDCGLCGGVEVVRQTNDNFGIFFFFQAEDGIRGLVRSGGLGDVYKEQDSTARAHGVCVCVCVCLSRSYSKPSLT